jgi:hypothetical protein
MASNRFRGIRTPTTGNTFLGRVGHGSGDVQPVSIAKLSSKVTQSPVFQEAVSSKIPAGANPTATAGPTAVNGSALTFMRSDAAPAVQTATTGQLGLVKPDGTTITISGGTISASGGSSSSSLVGNYVGSLGSAGTGAVSQGNAITPYKNMAIETAVLYANTTASDTYQIGIAPFNTSTKKITGSPTYSATYTAAGSTVGEGVVGVFASVVNLTAGDTYIVFLNWIDAATASTALTMYYNGTAQLNAKYTLNGNVAYGDGTTNPPSTGDTWSSEGDIYGMTLYYS